MEGPEPSSCGVHPSTPIPNQQDEVSTRDSDMFDSSRASSPFALASSPTRIPRPVWSLHSGSSADAASCSPSTQRSTTPSPTKKVKRTRSLQLGDQKSPTKASPAGTSGHKDPFTTKKSHGLVLSPSSGSPKHLLPYTAQREKTADQRHFDSGDSVRDLEHDPSREERGRKRHECFPILPLQEQVRLSKSPSPMGKREFNESTVTENESQADGPTVEPSKNSVSHSQTTRRQARVILSNDHQEPVVQPSQQVHELGIQCSYEILAFDQEIEDPHGAYDIKIRIRVDEQEDWKEKSCSIVLPILFCGKSCQKLDALGSKLHTLDHKAPASPKYVQFGRSNKSSEKSNREVDHGIAFRDSSGAVKSTADQAEHEDDLINLQTLCCGVTAITLIMFIAYVLVFVAFRRGQNDLRQLSHGTLGITENTLDIKSTDPEQYVKDVYEAYYPTKMSPSTDIVGAVMPSAHSMTCEHTPIDANGNPADMAGKGYLDMFDRALGWNGP